MTPESPIKTSTTGTPKRHSVFQYHACAQGFSAQFSRPFHEHVDVQAATSLPVTGGHGSAAVENFRFHEFLSFKRAYSHVSGGFQAEDSSNNTLVTSVVEGLNLMDVLTIGRVVCRLYSKHPADAHEASITLHGSKFEDVTICGESVKIDLDFDLFERLPSFKHACDLFNANDAAFKKVAGDPFETGTVLPQQGSDGAFLCSLIKHGSLHVKHPGVDVKAHSIHVRGFGTVYFAETFITHGQRTLTMLRFDLGSSTKAGGAAASGTTNGKQYPPG
jgi:hypothetical protein